MNLSQSARPGLFTAEHKVKGTVPVMSRDREEDDAVSDYSPFLGWELAFPAPIPNTQVRFIGPSKGHNLRPTICLSTTMCKVLPGPQGGMGRTLNK